MMKFVNSFYGLTFLIIFSNIQPSKLRKLLIFQTKTICQSIYLTCRYFSWEKMAGTTGDEKEYNK